MSNLVSTSSKQENITYRNSNYDTSVTWVSCGNTSAVYLREERLDAVLLLPLQSTITERTSESYRRGGDNVMLLQAQLDKLSIAISTHNTVSVQANL